MACIFIRAKAITCARDPFDLFPKLNVDADGAHAFYLGYELAKAEIAMQLGKRYAQDNPLDWGIAADKKSEDLIAARTRGCNPQSKRAGCNPQSKNVKKPEGNPK